MGKDLFENDEEFARYVQLPFSNYQAYLEIAQDNLKQAQTLRSQSAVDLNNNFAKSLATLNKLEKPAVIAVVFAALAVEALINEYGRYALSDIFSDISRLKTVEKLRLFPRLAGKRSFSPETIEQAKSLLTMRNELVHAVGKEVEILKINESHWTTPGKAAKAVEIAVAIFGELRTVDPSFK